MYAKGLGRVIFHGTALLLQLARRMVFHAFTDETRLELKMIEATCAVSFGTTL